MLCLVTLAPTALPSQRGLGGKAAVRHCEAEPRNEHWTQFDCTMLQVTAGLVVISVRNTLSNHAVLHDFPDIELSVFIKIHDGCRHGDEASALG